MQVRDLMTADPELVSPDTSIREAAQRMRDADVGALPVGDANQLTGMVTDRDIVIRAVAEGRSGDDVTVRDIVTTEIVSCGPDDAVEDAANLMAEHQIRRLPVVEDGRLVGIIALGDVAREDQDAGGAALDDISEPEGAGV